MEGFRKQVVGLVVLMSGLLSPVLGYSFNPNVQGEVLAIAVQTDGKIIIAGEFTEVCGETRFNIARIHTNGALDSTFIPYANKKVKAIEIQPDGKILVGGEFTRFNNVYDRDWLVRLNYNGQIDSSFNHEIREITRINAIHFNDDYSDGRITVGGQFRGVDYYYLYDLTRLLKNGKRDLNYNRYHPISGEVYCLDYEYVGGDFFLNSAKNFASLDWEGYPGGSFRPKLNGSVYVTKRVRYSGYGAIVGGDFSTVDYSETRNNIAKFKRQQFDYILDPDYHPNINDAVKAIAIQSDDKAIVGGEFTSVDGETRNHIARLNTDGSLDLSFAPDVNGNINAIAIQSDGKLIIGGLFTSVDGLSRIGLARIDASGGLELEPSPTVTLTSTITNTSTVTPTASPTPTITETNTPTPTVTQTSTATPDFTCTPTFTASPTNTGTCTQTPTPTCTGTSTKTSTITPTFTPTNTITSTDTITPTITATASYTKTITETATFTVTSTATIGKYDTFGHEIIAFPNPARDYVKFALKDPLVDKVTINIFNLLGERIGQIEEQNPGMSIGWDVLDVAPGIYLIQTIVSKNGQSKQLEVKKIAIVH